jgi:serine-threonine kinase receptor-associated protein
VLNLVSLPAQAYSASLHPDKSVFVAGGEDFKIYKFAYDDGKEMGTYVTDFGW